MELHTDDVAAQTNAGDRLQQCRDGFLESLAVQGYSPATIDVYSRLVRAQCSELTARGLDIETQEAAVAATLSELAPKGSAAKTRALWESAARRFVRYLCDLGILDRSVPKVVPEPDDLRRLRVAYENWLRHQRGLSDETVKNNLQIFNAFMRFRFADKAIQPDRITPADLVAFLVPERTDRGTCPDRTKASRLRNLLRFLHWSGRVPRALVETVSRTARHHLTTPRAHLEPAEVQRLLDAVQGDSALARRNYAILLLTGRLGLRAREVVAIRLEDIRWRLGEILIRGKGNRHDPMPLPVDVGEALVDYIRHGMNRNPFAICLQRFFTDHLTTGLRASAHTIASYRDTFRLLLNYASGQLGRTPTDLTFEDLDANLVGRFLGFVETVRGNSVRSRNTRLSAIRSFFKYVATHEPQLVHHCHRVLSIPAKRYERTTVTYLDQPEMAALVAAPDSSTWFGRRDRTLLVVALQTGLRVSELINLSRGDIVLGAGAYVRCMGKGRKERATPLRKDSVDALRSWLTERPGNDGDPVFTSIRGGRLSRDAVERIVGKYTALATEVCPSLKDKRVTPHVLRHAAAMTLLQSGVDCAVIALWLGHESVETTQIYLHADLQLKEKAMDQTKPVGVPSGRYHPPDEVMAFLQAL